VKNDVDSLEDQIDAVLPQTQCRQCGFAGCRPYARALAAGNADINLCPPGGAQGVKVLADLLGLTPKPLAGGHPPYPLRMVAVIDETLCIGCVKCIQACPVDAIVGAPRHMHTVLASECTGCALCISLCPVDCLALRPPPEATAIGTPVARDRTLENVPGSVATTENKPRHPAPSRADRARERYEARLTRLARDRAQQKESARLLREQLVSGGRGVIRESVERAKRKRLVDNERSNPDDAAPDPGL
jgi:electron transport complex protein RnfB